MRIGQPPATPEAQEAVAVCAAEATPQALAKRVPQERLQSAFRTAADRAVFPDMKRVVHLYGEVDLAELAAKLREKVEAVGVRECRLLDELEKVAAAKPTPQECGDALIKVLEALTSVSPEFLEPIAAAGCAEMEGCGRECVPGLTTMAEAPAENRAHALATGCAAFRSDMSQGPGAFARARLGAFVDACTPLLGAQAERAAELRKQIGI